MPELPEVETTRRGIYNHVVNRQITQVWQSGLNLRKLFAENDAQVLIGCKITDVKRRGKYLIVRTNHEWLDLLIHLGMSGSLRVMNPTAIHKKHDHIIITLDSVIELRYHDTRRFGFITAFNRQQMPNEIATLGVEPLSAELNGEYLFVQTRDKKRPIKDFIMDQKKIVGVGNIYATEALFMSRIHPQLPAEKLSMVQCDLLCDAIKKVLTQSIEAGGTTLRDFVQSDGNPGYFKQTLQVYGRSGEACFLCGETISAIVIGGRNSAFCPHCQVMPKL